MKRLLHSFALTLLTGSAVWGQQFSCATTQYHNQLVQEDPTILKDLEKLIANAMVQKSDDDTTVFVIPVVFHIIHQNGPENILDAQVHNAMNILNRDYRKMNADTATVIPIYRPLVGDVRIEFKLASYDPWGNCTNGIDRLYSHETTIGDAFCKLNQWDRSKYLNIWVVRSMEGGTAGYAHYPTDVNGLGYWRDGIVLRHNYIGGSGTGFTGSEYASRALTHEVGHWLALPHVWGSTNNPGVACGDDGINDTPETKGHTSINGCPTSAMYTIDCDKHDFTAAVYNFDNTTTTSGATDTTAVPNQEVNDVTRIEFSNFEAVGVSSNSTQDGVFSFTDWETGGTDGETVYTNLTGTINTSKYYEFTLTPQAMQGMNMTFMNFRAGRNATGARTFVVRSSADNFSTNIAAAISPVSTQLSAQSGNVFFFNNDVDTSVVGARINFSGANFTNVYTPITFRIYAFNAEDAAGTFSVDNVTINGTYGSIENVQNYMEYSYCSHMFTHGQVAVMRHALQSADGQRQNLITAETHQATGVDLTSAPICVPTPDIKSNRIHACVGNSVQFTDQSFNGPVTFREWVFEDATPATSTAANPTVVFNSPGLKTVTITVGNASGQATKTFQRFIDVASLGAAYTGPNTFSFEPELQYQELRYNNDGDNYSKFEPVGVGYNSSRSLRLKTYKDISGALPGTFESFYYESLGGQVDEIVTPTFDLRHTNGVEFSFDYSYATNAVQSTLMTEQIQIFYSRNCGDTWIPLGGTVNSVLKGSALASAGFAGNIDFTPSSNAEWSTFSRPLATNSTDNLTRFKITFTASDYSNNLFIDNIRVTGTLGLQDDFSSDHELMISPNPVVSGNDLNIQYVAGSEPVTFILRNLQGEEITSVVRTEVNQAVSFGFEISPNIAAAYYFLEVKSANGTTVKKIAVIK